MRKNKRYEIYVEAGKQRVKIGSMNSAEAADTIYSVCIRNMKNGLNQFHTQRCKGKITKVYIVCRENGAKFSFSLTEGFKEEFREAA